MRTSFSAADCLSLFFLLTLVPQCLGRPASALFGKGHKALPLSERRDSAIAERRESIIDRRDSVLSRRDSVLPQDEEEHVEAEVTVESPDAPILADPKYNRIWFNEDKEKRDSLDEIIQGMGYEEANIEARQVSSSFYGVFATSSDSGDDTATSYYGVVTSSLSPATTASLSAASTSTSASASASVVAASANAKASSSVAAKSSSSSSSAAALVTGSTVYPSGYLSKTAIVTPTVVTTTVHGTASHSPMMTYVSGQKSAALPSIPVTPQINYVNSDMQTGYPMWNGSGSLIVNSANAGNLQPMTNKPSMSRDQGKGGNVAGVNIFLFADTGTYSNPPTSGQGSFTGFVSNSIAVDRGLGPASGQPLTLADPIGAYTNKAGATRGFIPWTTGEQAYNNMMIPYSQRWAIWPESSIIPLNPTTGLLYAPIIYANTSGGSSFSFAGVTLLEITVPSIGGPVANRIAPLLFPKSVGVEWGCLGGIRSFGPNGQTGGRVYILGNSKTGLFIGRTNATQVTDPTSYQFFWGNGIWNSTVPTLTSKNQFSQGAFSTVDIFYSPRHLTFIMVFMNVYCDNNIYWRWLKAPVPILPKYAGGTWDDIAEALTMYPWGPTQVLVSLPPAKSGYTYGGGMHPGYFGANDITRGGNQMLLTWTAPTGQAGGTTATSYSTMSGAVTFT